MGHPVLDRVERPVVEEVGCLDGVARVAECVGGTADGVGEPECMVEDDDLSHRRGA
jgi:hypothetical protein